MIAEKILEVARPYLDGHKVTDIVVGIALIGVELDGDKVGVSYMLRNNLPSGCGSFSFARHAVGKDAYEVAKLLVTGEDDAQRGLGCAVLDAASQYAPLEFCDDQTTPFGVTIHPDDRLAMVGFMAPVAKQFEGKVTDTVIFDLGRELDGYTDVTPCDKQAEVLPTCDIVIASGTTSINQTLDDLIAMASNAREIVLTGTSTPMFPEAYVGTGVTSLGGAWWKNEEKEQIFRNISLACGIMANRKLKLNKCVRVPGAPTC